MCLCVLCLNRTAPISLLALRGGYISFLPPSIFMTDHPSVSEAGGDGGGKRKEDVDDDDGRDDDQKCRFPFLVQ